MPAARVGRKENRMAAGTYFDKLTSMLSFIVVGLKGLLWTFILGSAVFVGLTIASHGEAGKWYLGDKFDEWYMSIPGVTPVSTNPLRFDPLADCLSCRVFANIFDMMNMVGLKMFEFLHETAWVLLVMGFALWLLVKVFKEFVWEGSDDIKGLVESVFKRALWIGVIAAAIGFMGPGKIQGIAKLVLENTAGPLISMGTGVGSAVFGDVKIEDGVKKLVGSPVCAAMDFESKSMQSEVDGLIPADIKKDFVCLVNTINVAFQSGVTAGWNMVRLGGNWRNSAMILEALGGLIIAVIFFVLMVFFPFKLLDIVFTIGILLAFAPITIACYAYDETKEFAKKTIDSLVGIMFKLVMFCIFVGILYASFIYIGDLHYPGPLDGFTFLFPGFIYKSMGAGRPMDQNMLEAFNDCYEKALRLGDSIKPNQICTCMNKAQGITCEMPSWENPAVSLLPIFTLGLVSIMIFGRMDRYTDMMKGYMFEIGGHAEQLFRSSISYVWSGAKRTGSAYIKYSEGPLSKIRAGKLAELAAKVGRAVKGGS